nr:PIN domain-containing protein [uncultured Halomonas sp.]
MAMVNDNMLFIDTNILIYANVMETPFHEQALEAINTARRAGRTLWISRQIIREYLVTMTRPQTFENLPKSKVLKQVDQFVEHFHIADDTSAVTDRLVKLIGDFSVGGKQIHDANIVATLLAYDIPCLLTHNVKDFNRFDKIITVEHLDEK